MIQKETWEKYMPVEMAERGNILKEGFESESVRVALTSFEAFLRSIGIQGNNLNIVLENMAAYLVLFERLTRREERDKKQIDEQVNHVIEKISNFEKFKYSLMMLSDQYTVNQQEKTLINKIIKRMKLDKVESKENENLKTST